MLILESWGPVIYVKFDESEVESLAFLLISLIK